MPVNFAIAVLVLIWSILNITNLFVSIPGIIGASVILCGCCGGRDSTGACHEGMCAFITTCVFAGLSFFSGVIAGGILAGGVTCNSAINWFVYDAPVIVGAQTYYGYCNAPTSIFSSCAAMESALDETCAQYTWDDVPSCQYDADDDDYWSNDPNACTWTDGDTVCATCLGSKTAGTVLLVWALIGELPLFIFSLVASIMATRPGAPKADVQMSNIGGA